MLLQVLMAVFMEKNTPKNSANSSKPPSQTPKDESALGQAGTNGKGKATDPSRSANTRTVESVHISKVAFCEHCGEDLHKTPCAGYERRTRPHARVRNRAILARGARELPPIPPKQNGQRGRIAKSDAHNLWERLKEHEGAVLLFARHPHVPFTNNRAERDLRMSKVKQKVAGCFRKAEFAQASLCVQGNCRISSYLQPWPTAALTRSSPSNAARQGERSEGA